jgi:hypothetical protein
LLATAVLAIVRVSVLTHVAIHAGEAIEPTAKAAKSIHPVHASHSAAVTVGAHCGRVAADKRAHHRWIGANKALLAKPCSARADTDLTRASSGACPESATPCARTPGAAAHATRAERSGSHGRTQAT